MVINKSRKEIFYDALRALQMFFLELHELIERAGQELVAGVSLRDIFEDKSLGADKKSFTFRVLLQSPDRTLTDDEMRQIQEKIWGALREGGFEVR